MYDRQTESLWSQIKGEAIAGPMTGAKLKALASYPTTWEAWRSRYPHSLVLSLETGYTRDYGRNPYQGYWEMGQPPRVRKPPAQKPSVNLRPMERVLGVQVGETKKAYPLSVLKKMPETFEDEVAGKKLHIHFDKKAESGYVTDERGTVVPSVILFWFAWSDFYPETLVFTGRPNEKR